MTLQAAIEVALPDLRREAEARMTSTATVRRMTNRTAQNEQTGEEVPVWEVVYTDLPLFTFRGIEHRTVTIAGVETTIEVRKHALPMLVDGSPLDLRKNDYVDVVTREGLTFVHELIAIENRDGAKSRRVDAVEVSRPEEWA